MNLYLTCDRIGTQTGGGLVTLNEYRALETLGEAYPVDNARVPVDADPFKSDQFFAAFLAGLTGVTLTQIYAGCFTDTVKFLHAVGSKVSYTAAAHSIDESRREFEGLGIPFNFPHLTVPELWERYVGGYREADLVICPSTYSKKIMEGYGCRNVKVIPHGCELPATVSPLPKKFTVGIMGSAGPDKGFRYLFAAWKKLNLKDGLLLVAGNNIDQALPLWRQFGGGNVEFTGFVKDISDFFGRISILAVPSVTEGFNIEVLEALAHGRPVICSEGAGAKDVIRDYGNGLLVQARDSEKIQNMIEKCYRKPSLVEYLAGETRKSAADYTWEKVRAQYVEAWKGIAAL